MTQNTGPESVPSLDIPAILASLQDQIDDLQAAVEAQQATIERLLVRTRDPS